jgi:hypothetical protein
MSSVVSSSIRRSTTGGCAAGSSFVAVASCSGPVAVGASSFVPRGGRTVSDVDRAAAVRVDVRPGRSSVAVVAARFERSALDVGAVRFGRGGFGACSAAAPSPAAPPPAVLRRRGVAPPPASAPPVVDAFRVVAALLALLRVPAAGASAPGAGVGAGLDLGVLPPRSAGRAGPVPSALACAAAGPSAGSGVAAGSGTAESVIGAR